MTIFENLKINDILLDIFFDSNFQNYLILVFCLSIFNENVDFFSNILSFQLFLIYKFVD